MIITRTPFRVSLFGGGTDHPQWFRQHGGAVLGFAIDKYCYVSVRSPLPFPSKSRYKLIYSEIEAVDEIHDIRHPAIRGILQERGIDEPIEIHHDADLPARSGMGSSSSFVVGLLSALDLLDRDRETSWHPACYPSGRAAGLAKSAIRIEQEVLKESVGCQDQIWAAYGGFRRINFFPAGAWVPMPVESHLYADLVASTLLFFTGFTRLSSDFAAAQLHNFDSRIAQLQEISDLTNEATQALERRYPVDHIGALLHASWRLKRELADEISNPRIDEIYDAGRAAGALGGKLLGAGGGGFMAFIVPPEKQEAVKERLKDLVCVPVGVDTVGTCVVLDTTRKRM